MEIRQLEYFREIATTGSINEAARRLNMSQPPLSYQMKQLEAELNVTLFERTRTGVTLTEAGKLLYERAENLLNFVSSTRQEVAEAGKKRVLRIGITPTTVGTMMPFISEFARKNPDVNFEVHDGITYTLYNYLMDGIVDVAVVRTPLRLDGVEYTELHQEPMIAVIPSEMRLERECGLRLKDLMNSPLILYRRYEKFIMDAFSAQNLTPDIFCLCDDARGAGRGDFPGIHALLLRGAPYRDPGGAGPGDEDSPDLEKRKAADESGAEVSGYMHEINCVSCGAAGAIRRYRRKASRKITPTGFSVI